MDCIFCKIVNDEIPSSKVYEDDKVMAFLDINPANVGHTLVITKEHYETFDKIPSETLEHMINIVQKIAKAVIKTTNCDGYNILMNNNEEAGQLVKHVHFHIIPRFKDDGVVIKLGSKEFKDISDEIKENVS